MSRAEVVARLTKVISTRGRLLWSVLAMLWLCATGAGLAWLMAYDNTPGLSADAPASWPSDTTLRRDTAGETLVMLAHPRCDCTRASLGELAELLARAKRPPRTFIVFIRPGGVDAEWEKTPAWEEANDIPGATVIRDNNGAETQRFGGYTSGQTLLFDRNGRLIFSGGITAARGKSGDNAGRDAILALLEKPDAKGLNTRVFGCALFSGSIPPGGSPRNDDVD